MRARLPVRSAIFKHDTGGLVVKWVTISESLLLYVFAFSAYWEVVKKRRLKEEGDNPWKYL
jgi:hypothetical protein